LHAVDDVNVQIQQLMTILDFIPTKVTLTFAESTSGHAAQKYQVHWFNESQACHVFTVFSDTLQSDLCVKALFFGPSLTVTLCLCIEQNTS